MLGRLGGLALYSTSCWCLHHLLLGHYYTACRSSILAFVLPDTPYCTFVDASLRVLQCSPLLVAAPLLLSHKCGTKYFFGRLQEPSLTHDATETEKTCQ